MRIFFIASALALRRVETYHDAPLEGALCSLVRHPQLIVPD